MLLKKRCILVLGMHRSGTSALTRVVNLLGADLSSQLISSKPSNLTGFWESQQLLDIHNVLLKQFGLLWYDYLPLPEDWLDHPATQEARDRILEYLHGEFSDSSLFTIKDPRMCRLVPLWLQALEAFGAEPVFLICYRHPLEVAASLKKRDLIPVETSQDLWMRSYLETELETRGYKRLIVSYDDLLNDWREVANRISKALDVDWPHKMDDAAPAIDGFLSSSHRHHNELDFGSVENPQAREILRAMNGHFGLVDSDDSGKWEAIRQSAGERLDAQCDIFGAVIRFERTAMFTERDQKRRLKHYSARLKNKLRLEKARLKKLKRKWKWIVAIAVLLAGLLGWSAGHYMSARIPASDEAGSLRVEP